MAVVIVIACAKSAVQAQHLLLGKEVFTGELQTTNEVIVALRLKCLKDLGLSAACISYAAVICALQSLSSCQVQHISRMPVIRYFCLLYSPAQSY